MKIQFQSRLAYKVLTALTFRILLELGVLSKNLILWFLSILLLFTTTSPMVPKIKEKLV